MDKYPTMLFGQVSSYDDSDPSNKEKVERAIQDYNEVKDLLSIADALTTLPTADMQEILKDSMMHASYHTAEYIFKTSTNQKCTFNRNDHGFTNDRLAVALVCSAIARMDKYPTMLFGKVSSYDDSDPSNKEKVERAIQEYNEVKDLLSIADAFTTLPTADMQEILKDSMMHAGYDIAERIFGTSNQKCTFNENDHTYTRDRLATAVVCSAIAHVAKFGFSDCVYGKKADDLIDFLIYNHDPMNWAADKKLGDDLLTEVLIRKHDFGKYADNKDEWFDKLRKIFSNEVYIIGTLVKAQAGERAFPIKMKLFFLKALCQDEGWWQKMNETKEGEMTDLEQTWINIGSQTIFGPIKDFVTTENHMNLVTAWLHENPLFPEVQDACYKVTKGPAQDGRTWTAHGADVSAWLDESTGPTSNGLRVQGVYPSNETVN